MSKNKELFTGKMYADFLTSGGNNLINDKRRIDALNVFPVPDGDTGTNMSDTIASAINALNDNKSDNLGEVSEIVSKAMLLGARGNSGVILSQIFKGFSISFKNKKSVDVFGLIEGFKEATKKAYKSVLKPVEGTILTVIRETTEELEKSVNKDTSIKDFFISARKFARISCDNTPNKLKELRQAGLVDSGGEGLHSIIEGMALCAEKKPVKLNPVEDLIHKFISAGEIYDGEFGYCTEFIIELVDEKAFNIDKFTKLLKEQADSLVVVQDEKLVKVHGHTLKPGDLLNFGQKYGEFIKIKSENMSLQAEAAKKANQNGAEKSNSKTSKNAIISCNAGPGIIDKMRELGCDQIVEGGQTQNPSAAEIIDAINECNAKNVFVLPNNSNIFLAAQQAAQAVKSKSKKKVHIISTKSQLQGINAMIAFDRDGSVTDNKNLMKDMIAMIRTGEITKAVRDTKIDGIKIKKDNFISILDGKIISCRNTYLDAAKSLIKEAVNDETELVTIYFGDQSSEPDALELSDYIERYYECDIEIINGKQANYHFLIGIE